MAQTIEIPAQVRLMRRPLIWRAGKAEYIHRAANKPHVSVFRITEPSTYDYITFQVGEEDRSAASEVLICDVPPSGWPLDVRDVDGWKMRDEFLRLDRTSTAGLLEFLNRYGDWNTACSPLSTGDEWKPNVVLPRQIWFDIDPRKPERMIHLQELIRWGLICQPEKWFNSSLGRVSPIGPQDQFPYFVIQEFGCERVILATITIDRLRNTKYRLCARPDCKRPFAKRTKHKKDYCRNYCAHLESVRRNRR